MYKSRTIFGAFASASILATAVAGPALAGTSRTGINGPVLNLEPGGGSSLNGVMTGLSGTPLGGLTEGAIQGVVRGASQGAAGGVVPQLGATAGNPGQAGVPGPGSAGGAQSAMKGGSPNSALPASNDLGMLTGDLEALPGVGALTSELGAVDVG